MEELREEVGERESRQVKNGRTEGGGWWRERVDKGRMEELREEVGERESRQVKNGRTEGGGW